MAASEVPTRGFIEPLVQPEAPRISLRRSAVNDPNAATDQRWVEGFSFLPAGCGTGQIVSAQCPDSPETKRADDLPGIITYVPFGIVASARCSTMGGPLSMDYLQARAAQVLDSVTDFQMEGEFWTGTYAQANGLPNDYLANASTLTDLSSGSTVFPGRTALGALQDYLAGCSGGGRGMIHATRSTVTMWFGEANNGLRREGNLILDGYDNLIVAGVGYDGSSPDGDIDATGETAWAYATSMVEVKIGAVDPITTSVAQAINRATNDATFRAEKPVAAFWDGCCHAGILVGVCETACVGA